MIAFIEDQRIVYGVESICRVLPIAPSTYYHRLACLADPSKASARHQRDTELRPEIKRVWDENYQVYEPPLVCRRLIISSHATISNALNCA